MTNKLLDLIMIPDEEEGNRILIPRKENPYGDVRPEFPEISSELLHPVSRWDLPDIDG